MFQILVGINVLIVLIVGIGLIHDVVQEVVILEELVRALQQDNNVRILVMESNTVGMLQPVIVEEVGFLVTGTISLVQVIPLIHANLVVNLVRVQTLDAARRQQPLTSLGELLAGSGVIPFPLGNDFDVSQLICVGWAPP